MSRLAVFKGGLFLFLQQLLSRGLTFIASQVLLRFMTAQKLGLATQLDVYYLSVVFFARESLRVAVQRQPLLAAPTAAAAKDDAEAQKALRKHSQAALNTGALAVPLGLLVALLLRAMFRRVATSAAHVPLALDMYTGAAIIELSAEPFFAVLAAHQAFSARAVAESAGALARCIATLASAYYAAAHLGRDAGVLPFAAGQLAYAVVLWAVYARRARTLARAVGCAATPRPVGAPAALDGWVSVPTLRLAASLQAQGVVKHFLTQGDTLIVALLAGATAQGVYALANNYGGLVARLVFQPVEEMSRGYFGRLLAAGTSTGEDTNDDDKHTDEQSARKQTAQKAAADLSALLKIYMLFSTIVVAVGPPAAAPAIQLLAGTRWAADGAGAVLATYCYYIPLLALNGVSEAFVAAVATEAQVHVQSLWMAGFSGVFAAAGYVFLGVLRWQAAGLVYANIVNMACRIAWSVVFVARFFQREGVCFDVLELRPGAVAAVAAVAGPEVIRRVVAAVAGGANPFVQLVATAAAAVPVVVVVVASELPFLRQLYASMQTRNK